MKSILSFLGLQRDSGTSDQAETETVRRIVAELEALPADRARYVAAFAYTLGRVANADLEILPAETGAMESLVAEHGNLPAPQATLVVEIAKSQNRLFGGTENFLVIRELGNVASDAQLAGILDCLFAVSAADGSISGAEEQQIRMIAEELGFTPAQFIAARSRYNEHRSIIQRLDERQP